MGVEKESSRYNWSPPTVTNRGQLTSRPPKGKSARAANRDTDRQGHSAERGVKREGQKHASTDIRRWCLPITPTDRSSELARGHEGSERTGGADGATQEGREPIEKTQKDRKDGIQTNATHDRQGREGCQKIEIESKETPGGKTSLPMGRADPGTSPHREKSPGTSHRTLPKPPLSQSSGGTEDGGILSESVINYICINHNKSFRFPLLSSVYSVA